MKLRAALSLGLAAWLALTPLGAVDVYVDVVNGSDTLGDGSAGSPFATIEAGLARAAALPGLDRVLVEPGTYPECFDTGLDTVDVVSTEFDAAGTSAATVLDGGGGTGCGATLPIAIVDLGSTLAGFTVRNGRSTGIVALGGAVITNNVITANEGAFGGGIYALGTATITNNVITQNVASYGGGMYLYATDYFDETAELVVENNDVDDNEALLDGGGAYVFSVGLTGNGPPVRVENNNLRRNTADGFGGGAAVFAYADAGADVSVRVTTNTLDGNSVTNPGGVGAYVGYGGGIWAGTNGVGTERVRIDNNTINANTTTVAGGGISAWMRVPSFDAVSDQEIVIENNDVTSNVSDGDAGGMDLYLEALSLQAGIGSMRMASRENLVTGNRADGNTAIGIGGGILGYLLAERLGRAGEIDFTMERDEVSGNTAIGAGGGLGLIALADADPEGLAGTQEPAGALVRVTNALVAENRAGDGTGSATGGGVWTYLDAEGDAIATLDLDLVTVAANVADVGGAVELESAAITDTTGTTGTVAAGISNTIVADNDGFGVGGPPAGSGGVVTAAQAATLALDVVYGTVFGNTSGGIESSLTPTSTLGTLFEDPLLDADFVPGRCSPSIDAGDPADDFSLEPPFNGDRINQGDLGGTALAVRTLSDINGDRIVDGLDVIQITTRFASAAADPVYLADADFDGNLFIDGDDLALVAADFGLECP